MIGMISGRIWHWTASGACPGLTGRAGTGKGSCTASFATTPAFWLRDRFNGRQFQPLEFDSGSELPDGSLTGKADEAPAEDFRPLLELGLDTERVLAGLPEDLQRIARYLAEMPISAVRRKTGLSLAQVNRRIRQIRAAFMAAGFAPGDCGVAR